MQPAGWRAGEGDVGRLLGSPRRATARSAGGVTWALWAEAARVGGRGRKAVCGAWRRVGASRRTSRCRAPVLVARLDRSTRLRDGSGVWELWDSLTPPLRDGPRCRWSVRAYTRRAVAVSLCCGLRVSFGIGLVCALSGHSEHLECDMTSFLARCTYVRFTYCTWRTWLLGAT